MPPEFESTTATPPATVTELPAGGTAEPNPITGGAVPGPARGPRGQFLPRPPAEAGSGGPEAKPAAVLPAKAKPSHPPAKTPIGVRQSKPVKGLEKAAIVRKTRESKEAARRASEAITQMIVTVLTIALGPDAEPSDALRERINGPQSRWLERMAPEQAEAVAKYVDPIELTLAYSEWGAQVYRVIQERRAERAAEEPAPTAKPAAKEPLKVVNKSTPPSSDGGNGHHPAEPVLPNAEPAEKFPGEDVPPTKVPGRALTPGEISAQMGKS